MRADCVCGPDHTIENELKQARLAHEDDRRDALVLILSSLRSAEKELQRPLSEDEELQVLQRERKKRVEAFEAFEAAGREEQADKEDSSSRSWRIHAGAPLRRRARGIVDDVIAEVGATSLRDIGRVMADVMPRISGKADGSAVSQIVRETRLAPARTCPLDRPAFRAEADAWIGAARRLGLDPLGASTSCTCAPGRR